MDYKRSEYTSELFKVAAFYCFNNLLDGDIIYLIDELKSIAVELSIKGTILLANEGFNGTICGSEYAVDKLISILTCYTSDNKFELKFSYSDQQAFRRLKIRRKPEIVTMGIKDIDPSSNVGKYVEPHDWNEFIDDEDTIVIDTRNHYEISIGTFNNSLNPQTANFREFPKWVDQKLSYIANQDNNKRVAMFCTGGIRCEKASSYLKKKGFHNVYHLHGGILRYLETVPVADSRWQGECFVFDQRVALNHQLVKGEHELCYACGFPLSPEDRAEKNFIPGIQCLHCIDDYSDADRARFAERHRQFSRQSDKAIDYNRH